MRDSTIRFIRSEAPAHQRAMLRTLLWFVSVAGVLFAALHVYLGDAWLGVAELLLVVIAAMLLVDTRHGPTVRTRSLLFLVPFFAVMMYGLASSRTGMSVFVWVLLVPILSPLLLGRWIGMSVAFVFMALAGSIFMLKLDWTAFAAGSVVAVANVFGCSIAIFVLSYVYEVSRERTELELRAMALTDALTGLANRARFRDSFASERQRFIRQKIPLSMLVVDVDHFKQVNDTHGHDAGDTVLRGVAEVLTARLRKTDLAARLGGEEFGVLLSGATREYAREVAEALRERVAAVQFRYRDREIVLTISVGVAEIGVDGMDFRTLFAAADHRLYEAKASGRNRVVS